MEESGQIDDILPLDDELLSREKVFLNLFEKFSIDEGSDPEGIEYTDSDSSTVKDSDNRSEQSFSESSDNEDEDNFDVEEMDQQLLPVINSRVNAWPEKGIHLQLRTIDSSVSVEDWLSTHSHEVTTTTKKYKKTIVNSKNSRTITTKKTTITTTTRKSYSLVRRGKLKDDKKKEIKAITNEEETDTVVDDTHSTIDEDAYKKHKRYKKDKLATGLQKNQQTNDLISMDSIPNIIGKKRFLRSSKPQKDENVESIAKIKRSNKSEPPEKMKKLLPTMSRKRQEEKVEPTAVISGTMDSHSEILGKELDHEHMLTASNVSGQSERKRILRRPTSSCSMMKPPTRIVIYSPGAGELLGTKIDKEFMCVTRKDYEKVIDPKQLRTSEESFIVPINQKIMYFPPITDDVEKEYNSESDDELLTSYTRTGHFVRIK